MPSLEELTDEQRVNLARAANQVLSNPETSREFKRLWKKANPKVSFPELDVQDTVTAELAKRDTTIEELRAAQMQDAAERRRDKEHLRARERGLNPEDVEKAVVDRRIMDWDTAMRYVELEAQSAIPTPSADEPMNKEVTSMKDLWNDPAKWAREQTHAAIDELAKRRRG